MRTVFIIILACAVWIPALTEQEAVLLALTKNPDIRVKEISLAKDSIVFKTVKSDAGVQILLSGNRLVEFHPGTRETYNGTSSTGQELKGNMDVTVSRHIPGGGNITALRTDEHSIRTALWADDSRGALIVTASASSEIPADTLVWLPVDGSPAIRLPVTGSKMLRWGADVTVTQAS